MVPGGRILVNQKWCTAADKRSDGIRRELVGIYGNLLYDIPIILHIAALKRLVRFVGMMLRPNYTLHNGNYITLYMRVIIISIGMH